MTGEKATRLLDVTMQRLMVSDILMNPHRSHILYILQRQGTPMTLDALVNPTECQNIDVSKLDPTVSPTTNPRTQLHHVHLPKLHKAGLIRYNSDEQVIVSLNEERVNALIKTGQQMLTALQQRRQ